MRVMEIVLAQYAKSIYTTKDIIYPCSTITFFFFTIQVNLSNSII